MSMYSLTGNIWKNFHRLKDILHKMNFILEISDYEHLLTRGSVVMYLKIYHHIFIEYSPFVYDKIKKGGYCLMSLNDQAFLTVIYNLIRDLFGIRPGLTFIQFSKDGFCERKMVLCALVAEKVFQMHTDLMKRRKVRLAARQRSVVPSLGANLPFELRRLILNDPVDEEVTRNPDPIAASSKMDSPQSLDLSDIENEPVATPLHNPNRTIDVMQQVAQNKLEATPYDIETIDTSTEDSETNFEDESIEINRHLEDSYSSRVKDVNDQVLFAVSKMEQPLSELTQRLHLLENRIAMIEGSVSDKTDPLTECDVNCVVVNEVADSRLSAELNNRPVQESFFAHLESMDHLGDSCVLQKPSPNEASGKNEGGPMDKQSIRIHRLLEETKALLGNS